MVRNSVGICDVSTLGKIDIQGPDAAAFLDFVYCNTFSTLKENRVRYGLMLREDGHVMDDGTTARLGPNHYVMTTTTAAAGQVMKHLDWVSQALRPDLDVSFTSVTEQWAQFAVAGPKSRDLLNTVLDDPIDSDGWPFMACGTVSIGGKQARLFRISFSGEHAYEIAVTSRYGAALFNLLLAQAESMGGGAYLRATGEMAAGAFMFNDGTPHDRVNAQGYLTSVCYSPTLGENLALGFLKNGRARHGEVIDMVDHLRGIATKATVCHPVFLDPKGDRARG